MTDELLAYYFHLHGIRNIRYTAPEFFIPVYKKYHNLTSHQKKKLNELYEKNKTKVFKLLEML